MYQCSCVHCSTTVAQLYSSTKFRRRLLHSRERILSCGIFDMSKIENWKLHQLLPGFPDSRTVSLDILESENPAVSSQRDTRLHRRLSLWQTNHAFTMDISIVNLSKIQYFLSEKVPSLLLKPRRQWKVNYVLLLVFYMRAASVSYCQSPAERLQNLVFF